MLLISGTSLIAQSPLRFYQGGKVGYKINDTTFIEPIYDVGSDYYEHYAVVSINGKYGFIDEHGKQLGFMEYEHAGVFSQGLAKVKKNGKYGFINLSGKILIDFEYDYVTDFSENVAGVNNNGKWALISVNGEKITNFVFDYIQVSSEGLIGVMKDEMWGFIDEKGSLVIPFEFATVEPFRNGETTISIKVKEKIEKWIINSEGKRIKRLESEE